MLVRQLIDILSDHPANLEVELAVIAPVEEESDDITVDQYPVAEFCHGRTTTPS